MSSHLRPPGRSDRREMIPPATMGPAMPRYLLVALVALIVASRGLAAEPDRAGIEFFEKKIRPVLIESCYRCHSEEAAKMKKLKGDLLLDTRDGVRRGGEGGPILNAQKPGDS